MRSIKHMSDAVVLAAIAAKRAEVESKRLHALAVAWELESTEKHAILLQALLRDNADQYVANVTEATYFERMLVKRSRQELEDDADFTVAAYSHDFAAHSIAYKQLDYLEEVGAE
jgi:porphobilinogen deaminase